MSLNISNSSINKYSFVSDKAEYKKIEKAPASTQDNIVDMTKSDQKQLAKDLEGAINTGKDVFIKSREGIFKIDKKDVPELLNNLKQKLNDKDHFRMVGAGFLDNNFVIQFKPTTEIDKASDKILNAQKSPEDLKNTKHNDKQLFPADSFKTREGRLNVLSNVSQLDDDNKVTKNDPARCGASAVVGAALTAEGLPGLKKLEKAIINQPEYKSLPPALKKEVEQAIKEIDGAIAGKNGVTRKSFSVLQEALYQVLQKREVNMAKLPEFAPAAGKLKEMGLQPATLAHFVQSNPDIKSMFVNNDMDLATIKLGKTDHFVLVMKEADKLDFSAPDKKMIYDPFDRKDGKQVVTDQAQVKNYLDARTDKTVIYTNVNTDQLTELLKN